MSWLVSRSSLSALQADAVCLSAAKHRVIMGGPLTGKTQVLLHRARYLLETHNLKLGQLRIWTSSEGTKCLLRSVAPLLYLDANDIERYDFWCEQTYRRAVDDFLPRNPIGGDVDTELIRLVSRYAVQWGFAEQPSYQVVLLDDADSFNATDLAFIRQMARHTTLFMRGSSTEHQELCASMGLNRPDVIFEKEYRGNPAITDFIANLRCSSANLDKTQGCGDESESPIYLSADDETAELIRLSQVLRERMAMDERIGILVPDQTIATRVARHLGEQHFVPEVEGVDSCHIPDFMTSNPKIFTFKNVRGLNFDTVIMPMLGRVDYRGYSRHEIIELIVRYGNLAKKWFYLSSVKPPALPQLEDIAHAGQTAKATRNTRVEKAQPRRQSESSPIDDLL